VRLLEVVAAFGTAAGLWREKERAGEMESGGNEAKT